jgi:uncharacterized SAM-binding protein YcdF (DUF218 family)
MMRILRWFRTLAATIGFLFLLVTFTPVTYWWTAALSSPWGPDQGDTLIVLGDEMTTPEVIGINSYWRSFYAVLIWRGAHFRRIIVTGRETAPGMRDFMAAYGVPRDAIFVEPNANSTRENALFVAKMLPPGKNILLTSDYHSRRALAAFRKIGIPLTALPMPVAGKRANTRGDRWPVAIILGEETIKMVWYKLHSWI